MHRAPRPGLEVTATAATAGGHRAPGRRGGPTEPPPLPCGAAPLPAPPLAESSREGAPSPPPGRAGRCPPPSRHRSRPPVAVERGGGRQLGGRRGGREGGSRAAGRAVCGMGRGEPGVREAGGFGEPRFWGARRRSEKIFVVLPERPSWFSRARPRGSPFPRTAVTPAAFLRALQPMPFAGRAGTERQPPPWRAVCHTCNV